MVARWLKRQVDKRSEAVLIPDEVLFVPKEWPYKVRLAELPRQSDSVKIIRYGYAQQTWWAGGGALCFAWGWNTLFVQRTYTVEIDTGGNIGAGATLKWSKDGGVTWPGTHIPITSEWPIHLENGVHVRFMRRYYLPDFGVSDTWQFTVYPWTEITGPAFPAASQYKVNYDTGEIEFAEADSRKVVTAYYYGIGGLCDIDDVNDLIDWMATGRRVWGGLDTSAFDYGEAVGFDRQKPKPRQLERTRTRPPVVPAIGIVSKVHKTQGEITLKGIVEALEQVWDIHEAWDYWLGDDDPGELGTPPADTYYGYLRQMVGRGVGPEAILVNIERPTTNDEKFVRPDAIQLLEAFGTPTVTRL